MEMFVMTIGIGMSNGMPDVCKTPPLAVPAPFPNLAMNAMAVPTYFTIMINGMPELNGTATHPTTNGDEAGALGGVASGTIMGPATCTLMSLCVFVCGVGVWRLTAVTVQNGINAPGVTSVPSQSVKQVMR
jgi:hypothetical protein